MYIFLAYLNVPLVFKKRKSEIRFVVDSDRLVNADLRIVFGFFWHMNRVFWVLSGNRSFAIMH